MKMAEYVVWIIRCKHCKFGEKILEFHSRDIEFLLGGYCTFWRALYIRYSNIGIFDDILKYHYVLSTLKSNGLQLNRHV